MLYYLYGQIRYNDFIKVFVNTEVDKILYQTFLYNIVLYNTTTLSKTTT